eukprot:TRINITY_DN2367_c0_g1_i1.p1 TRINITY_DN2367_c0_g1~~TRINITY_DN2367_c0_g1_i1.p1  ORF type:complete len:187 (+),score=28.21 TRINITY_DN2367_c0_g1_i1:304-864(+)
MDPSLDGEWEVVDDDGFVYKRRKTDNPLPSPVPSTSSALILKNNLQYLKQRRLLEKEALWKLKTKYSQEIKEWESLSRLMQSTPSSSSSPPSSSVLRENRGPHSSSSVLRENGSNAAHKIAIKELLLQVEVQEALLKDVANICNAAELICQLREEELKKPILDLPVWDPPSTFMDSLCPSSDSEGA